MTTTKKSERSDNFRWHSRWTLYTYFHENFNLVKKDVDREIYAVMDTFKPRRGRIIKTAELWQKVGMNLEERYTPSIDVHTMDQE